MPARVTRASKATREKIIKAASRAFARNGYDGASIRTIVAAADVNQAAINYHFGSKDGLYRAVLQAALLALMNDDGARPGDGALPREAAPFFATATELVRRFLPDGASNKQAVVGALWLFGQCSIFVRNAQQLSRPPFRLTLDERFVDWLADTMAAWAAGGLGRLPAPAER
jgi:AcrR family transcriptional regulator